MHPGPLKTDMILFPAVLATPGRNNLSEATFKKIQLGPTLTGWYALDDDDAKLRRRGSHRLRIFARPHASDTWTPLADLAVRHRPDRRHLGEVTVPPALQSIALDLRVEIETTGEAPTQNRLRPHPPRGGTMNLSLRPASVHLSHAPGQEPA
jgi:hypothetical protein